MRYFERNVGETNVKKHYDWQEITLGNLFQLFLFQGFSRPSRVTVLQLEVASTKTLLPCGMALMFLSEVQKLFFFFLIGIVQTDTIPFSRNVFLLGEASYSQMRYFPLCKWVCRKVLPWVVERLFLLSVWLIPTSRGCFFFPECFYVLYVPAIAPHVTLQL